MNSRLLTAQPAMNSRLLTPRQAAERLGVSLVWIYKNADSLPACRRLNARLLRFEERELEAWIAARKPLADRTAL